MNAKDPSYIYKEPSRMYVFGASIGYGRGLSLLQRNVLCTVTKLSRGEQKRDIYNYAWHDSRTHLLVMRKCLSVVEPLGLKT